MRIIVTGLLMLGLGLCGASVSIAGPTEVDGTAIDNRIYRGYEASWRQYARFSCEIDGDCAFFPNYDRRHPSSRAMTTSQVLDELSVEHEERNGNLIVKKVKRPPREDAEALSRALPEMTVGMYGWVASAEVVQIIDRNQMIIREVWLVDRDALRTAYQADEAQMARRNDGEVNRELLNFNYGARIALKELQEERDEGFEATFRLIGYDTRGLRVGDRWKGPNSEGFQVGVVKWEIPEPKEEDEGRRRRRDDDPRLVLSEIEQSMRQTLDEEGFKKLLDDRGMTVAAFVDLVRTMRQRDRNNAQERILNALLPEEILEDD